MSFDEQPDGDIHGECANEIHRLEQQNTKLQHDVARLRGIIANAESCYDCTGDLTIPIYMQLREALSSTADSDKWMREQKAKVLVEFATEWLPHIKDKDPQTSLDQTKQNATVDDCIKHAFGMANELRSK